MLDQILHLRVRQPKPEVSVVVSDDLVESGEAAVVVEAPLLVLERAGVTGRVFDSPAFWLDLGPIETRAGGG